MNFQIFCIGKIKEEFYKRQISCICGRLKGRGHGINIVEFPDAAIPDKLSESKREAFLEKECHKLSERIKPKDYVIALCIEGKEITTGEHRNYMEKAMDCGYETVTYVIGGSLGLPEAVKRRADLKLSFSKMTFPHQIMRMVLLEELAGALEV